MKIAEIRDIECAILHDSFAPMSGARLFDLVNTITRSLGLTAELQGGATDEYCITAQVGGMHVLVSQNSKPLGPEGFANVLAQPITQFMMPDAEARVARHKANTFITVSKGLHMPQPLLRAVNEYLPGLADNGYAFTDVESVKVAISLVHKIVLAVQKQVQCTAVHWCMSDQLVNPDFIEAIGKAPTLTPLCVRPNLFSSANRLGPGLPLGMVGNGSQYLIGRPVVFKEAAVELPWMMERMSNFIDMCHIRGNIVGHGESFGISNDEIIRVWHTAPTADYPLGTYELSAIHVPKFGITNRVAAAVSETIERRTQESDGETKLDPNDPIDKLILERLEERRVLEDRRAAEDRRQATQQGDYPNDRRATGTFGRRTMPFGRREQ